MVRGGLKAFPEAFPEVRVGLVALGFLGADFREALDFQAASPVALADREGLVLPEWDRNEKS